MSKIGQYLKRTNVKFSTSPTSSGLHTNPTEREGRRVFLTSALAAPLVVSAPLPGRKGRHALRYFLEHFRKALYFLMAGCTSGICRRGRLVSRIANGAVMEV